MSGSRLWSGRSQLTISETFKAPVNDRRNSLLMLCCEIQRCVLGTKDVGLFSMSGNKIKIKNNNLRGAVPQTMHYQNKSCSDRVDPFAVTRFSMHLKLGSEQSTRWTRLRLFVTYVFLHFSEKPGNEAVHVSQYPPRLNVKRVFFFRSLWFRFLFCENMGKDVKNG